VTDLRRNEINRIFFYLLLTYLVYTLWVTGVNNFYLSRDICIYDKVRHLKMYFHSEDLDCKLSPLRWQPPTRLHGFITQKTTT